MKKRINLINGVIHTGITTLEDCVLIISGGKVFDVMANRRIKRLEPQEEAVTLDCAGAHIAPGFIDTHIHGIHGYGTEDRSPDAILQMSEALTGYGVTAFCPTIYPESHEDIIRSIRAIFQVMGREKGATILGIHLEGPFISRKKKGVQREDFIQEVSLKRMKEYWEASQGHVTNMTVAPELKKMRELALYCSNKGIVLQAGHSNAEYREMLDGIQAGIIHSTHMFNAMRPLHHRDPGLTGAILIHSEVSCEIIADGFHVHPALINMLLREKPLDKVVLITDALKPTGQTKGKLIANGEEVYLDEGVFKRKHDKVIAGSSLTMIEGVKNLCQWGIPLGNALKMASANPAAVLNLQKNRGTLLPGKRADITVFNDDFKVLTTIVGGKVIRGISESEVES